MSKIVPEKREYFGRLNTCINNDGDAKMNSYISLNRLNVYYFRINIPNHFRRINNSLPKDIKKSTKTKNKKDAGKIAYEYYLRIDDLFKKYESLSETLEPSVFGSELMREINETFKIRREQRYQQNIPVSINNTQPHYVPNQYQMIHNAPSLTSETCAKSESLKLSELIKLYMRHREQKHTWRKLGTKNEYLASLELFKKIIGEQELHLITHEMILDYQEKIQKIPANLNKIPEFKNKSIDEIIKSSDRAKLSPTTVNKHLSLVTSLFKFAEDNVYITRNYAKNLNITVKEGDEKIREAFNDKDLEMIFSTMIYSPESKDNIESHKYWLPLLALYTSARLGELCQLHVKDIVNIDGIDCISINSEDNKSVKTKSSRRIVPIHTKLIEFGFLEFVQNQKENGYQRLFPKLQYTNESYSRTMTKWFRRYRFSVGITSEHKVFHSFRHTASDYLKQKLVPTQIIAAIDGHKDTNITTGRYGKAYSVKILKKNIDKLNFKLPEIRHYSPEIIF